MAPKATAKATPRPWTPWPPAAAPSSSAATSAVGRRQPAAAPSARRKSAAAPALPSDDDDDDDVDEMDGDEEGEEVEVEDEEDGKEDEEEDTAVDSEGSDDSDDDSEVESDDASDHEVAQPPPAKRQATAAKPPRARSFADFQLDPRLTRALVKAKLTMPTLVQAEAIPVALQVRVILPRGSLQVQPMSNKYSLRISLDDGEYDRAVTFSAAPRPAPERPPPTLCRCCKRSWSPKR